MFWLFLSAAALGLAFCTPPGAIAAEALRRGLARGFRAAFLVEIVSLVGDATWAAIALAGAAFLVQHGLARLALGIVGAVFLARLGLLALRDTASGELPKARAVPGRTDFLAGAALSLTNPLAIAFWLGVGGGAVATLVSHPGPADFAVFYAGFMLACVVWCGFISGLIAFGRQILRPAFFRLINLACGLTLTFFAERLLLRVLSGPT